MNYKGMIVAGMVAMMIPTTALAATPGPVVATPTSAGPQWVCHLVPNTLGGVKFERRSIPQSPSLVRLWQKRYPRDVMISDPNEPCRERTWWRSLRDRVFTPTVIRQVESGGTSE